MKQAFILCFLIVQLSSTVNSFAKDQSHNLPAYFMHNKGQVRDKEGNVRKDIDFILHKQGTTLYVGCGFMEYHFDGSNQPLIMSLKNCTSKAKALAEGAKDYTENYYDTVQKSV